MPGHDRPSSIQAIAQIVTSRFPESVRDQQLKGFEGIRTLVSITRFHETFTHGIGSAKAFGFGLLVIAPLW